MSETLFAEIKKAIQEHEPYPGYPEVRFSTTDVTLDVPDGPWNMNNDNLPTAEESARFQRAGYRVDSQGRPLHPHYLDMVTDPTIGVVGGRGKYYHWGPNFTADPIVMTKTAQPRVLLIKRGDTGTWALPGGFVDPGETDLVAAKRELSEEAGLEIDGEAQVVYRGVVGDRRATAHAWPETGAYLWQIGRQVPVQGNDDAIDAKWFRLDQLDNHLFGSHNFLINEAKLMADFVHKKPIADILAMPKDELEIEIVDAGHMAYDHLFVTDGEDSLFVKEHDPSRFTDPKREAHSREYLEKEFAVYEDVAEQGFGFIPDRVDLVDDRILAMDALRIEDGWYWRAANETLFDPYVRDVLTALTQLQLVRIPKDPAYHKTIEPTHPTFWKEGWDTIDDEKLDAINNRVRELSGGWTDAQREEAETLLSELPSLREQASHIDRNPELFMAHNDARQSNIAWHPDAGARLVDWSWADPAPKNADTTMFLIDLLKSGYDVTPYLEYVNKDQTLLLAGMWLGHCTWNTRDGSTTVREQQVASAIAAWQLLKLID